LRTLAVSRREEETPPAYRIVRQFARSLTL
jgi:hypothetical protein